MADEGKRSGKNRISLPAASEHDRDADCAGGSRTTSDSFQCRDARRRRNCCHAQMVAADSAGAVSPDPCQFHGPAIAAGSVKRHPRPNLPAPDPGRFLNLTNEIDFQAFFALPGEHALEQSMHVTNRR